MRGPVRQKAASGGAHLRIAAVVTLVAGAVVAALAALIGKLPGAPTWIAAGAAAVAALVAGLGPSITGALKARQERSEARLAANARLARHLERIRQAYAEHLQAEHRWDVGAGEGAATVLERLVDRRDPVGYRGDRPDDRRKLGSLEDFVEQHDVLVLLGEGGAGKTTSLLRLAADAAARAERDPAAPIPIFVELKHFDVRASGFRRLYEMTANAFHAEDVEGFRALWREAPRPLLFLFDGLNEQRGDPATCVSALQEFASRPPHTFVVTSRPSPEAERLLMSGRGVVALDLLPLDQDQIRRLLDSIGLGWLWEQMDDALKGLSRNPFMLMALGQSCASLPSVELPRNVGELYETFIDRHIFDDREVRRGLVRYSYIDVKRPLLAWLAERMTKDGRTVVDRDGDLERAVEGKLWRIVRATGRRKVMPDDWNPTGFLDEAIANGILRSTGKVIEFMHQSVQEYFTARALADKPLDHVVERLPQLVWRHVDVGSDATGIDRDDRLTIPVLMLSGLMDDSGALVERLVRRDPLLAARCVAAAGQIDPETLSMLREEWVGLLSREHERYRWIGVRCLRTSRLVDSAVRRALVDLALDNPVYESTSEIASEAKKALAELGLGDAGSYLADKVESPYDAATKLLINADPRLAVDTLIARWQTAPSGEQRQAIQKALEEIDPPVALAELARVQLEAEQHGRSDRAEACGALLADLRSRKDGSTQTPGIGVTASQLREAIRKAQERALRKVQDATPDELLAALRSGNDLLRQAAASRLAEQGTPDMVPTLIEALAREQQEDTAGAIARVAYRLGGDEMVAQLLAKVWESDRQFLLRAQDCWSREPDASPPEPLRLELERVGIHIRDDATVVRHPHGWVIHTGRMTLLVEKADPHLEVQLTGLRSSYLEAAALIAPHQLLLPDLYRALGDDDPNVRAAAVVALGRAGDKRAVGPIKTLLGGEKEPHVASDALAALARIASPEALDTVLDTLIRTANLSRFGRYLQTVPESIDVDRLLCKRAQREKGQARSLLLQALATLREDRARSGRAVDGDADWRNFLIHETLASVHEESRGAAAEALRWGRGDPGTDKFIEALRSDDPARRAAAAVALGALQEDQAAEALKTTLADGDAAVRVAAAVSLCDLRTDDRAVWNVLADVVLGDEAESLRRRAAAALATRPKGKETIIDRIYADLHAGRYDAVEDGVTRFLTVERDDRILLFYRGLAREAQGDLNGALTDMTRASEPAAIAPIVAGQARVLATLGRHNDALAALQRATSLDSGDADLHINLGWYAYLAGDLDASLRASQRALELDPSSAVAAFNIALVHLARAEEAEAKRAYAAGVAVAASLEPDRRRSEFDAARRDLHDLRGQRPELASLIDDIIIGTLAAAE